MKFFILPMPSFKYGSFFWIVFSINFFTNINLSWSISISEEFELRTQGNMGRLKTVSKAAKEILFELNKDFKPVVKKKEEEKPKLDKFNAVRK